MTFILLSISERRSSTKIETKRFLCSRFRAVCFLGVFLSIWYTGDSTWQLEEVSRSVYLGTLAFKCTLQPIWRELSWPSLLSLSSNTNYLSLDFLFCFLLPSKFWEFSNRFKSLGKQRILLWGHEYIPDFLFEGWMQRREAEGRKSPLISQNITQPQVSAIHCWA